MSASQVSEDKAAYSSASSLEPVLGTSFDLLAMVPHGVLKLRELILSLAAQGRLVKQLASDESAANMLARFCGEFEPRPKRRKHKDQRAEPERHPFEIPGSWVWVGLSDVTYDHGQVTPTSEFAYIDVASIDNERGCIKDDVQVLAAADAPSRARKIVKKDSVIYSTVRPYLKNIAIVGEYSTPSIASTAFAVMQPFRGLLPEYLFFYLRSAPFTEFVASRMLGVAYPAINDANFFEGLLPLPPLAEQTRIVARVEELMQLCDALEAHGRMKDEQHARLVATLFDALATSESTDALAENWQRIAAHFDLLLDRPEAVDALEQTILQLAVRGRLVPQDSAGEPGSELLVRINSEKDRVGVPEQKKRTKPLPPIADDEKMFDIPKNWGWARMEAICDAIVDCPHSTAKFVETGVLCIDTNSFKSWELIPQKLRYVTEKTFEERVARLVPRPGDLVFAREGSVGESVLIPDDTRCCLGQRVMLFRLCSLVLNTYVQMALSSKDFLDRLLALHKGIGAKHVNVGDMRLAVIPVPPLAEQHRIVARVEQLRRLCADLRERLQQTRTTQSRLADALVSSEGARARAVSVDVTE